MRLGDEVLQLHPLDHQKDEPNTRASFAKVLALMSETGDWKNLPGFLEGLRIARRSVKGWQMEKMVRKANESGRMGVVHDCLRRVEGTGLGLWDVRVAREVMWGAVGKCVRSGWSKEGVEGGRKFAEDVWELMFDPRHAEKMVGREDAKKRPEVLGVLVQMHAAKAVLFGEGKDEGGKVEIYMGLMLGQWDNAELEIDEENWSDANYKLLTWAPVWHGMMLAQTVLHPSSPTAKTLKTKLTQDVEPLIETAAAALAAHPSEDGKRRGLKMYEELIQVSV